MEGNLRVQKSIKKNYLFNTAYQILTLITPLITTPYVSRILGADGIGTYSFADSVTSYFVLAATMGISIYGQREISYFQNDRQKRSDVFWNTKMHYVSYYFNCVLYICDVF